MALTGTSTANASTSHTGPLTVTTTAGRTGEMMSPKASAYTELWSPAGLGVSIWKTWNSDGNGGYSGKFEWDSRQTSGVWAEMQVSWESGSLERKTMILGHVYSYNGAYSVYMRACDSSGCGGWW